MTKPTYEELTQDLRAKREEIARLKSQLEALQAHADETKAYLKDAISALGDYVDEHGFSKKARKVLYGTPPQSLNHIKAQVEEETIERIDVVGYVKSIIEAGKLKTHFPAWTPVQILNELLAQMEKYELNIQHKYAKQEKKE